jgi:signal transduction histidine kinase/ligand-binding sensor domain-containing protein
MRKPINQIKIYFRALICVPAFLLTFSLFVARAERLPVKIYTSADGLGSSASFSLVRDSRGFIWLCSRDGLVRFDGYRFITYRIGAEDADTAVFDLIPTSSGVYWINLNRGTDYRFVPQSEDAPVEAAAQSAAKNDYRVPLKVEPITERLLPSYEDTDGNLWTTDIEDIYLMREVDGKWTYEPIGFKLPGNPTGKLDRVAFSRAASGFWVGTHWGLARRLPSGKTIHFSVNPDGDSDPVLFFAEDKQNRVWIARPDGLVVLKTGEISENSEPENLKSYRTVVKKGVVGANGEAQMPEQANEAFIFSFDDILLNDRKDESSADNRMKPELNEMICAADGKMWFTSTRGLITFDGKKFQHYTTEHGLAANVLPQIAEDNEGFVWVASYGGLHRINPHGLVSFDETNGAEKATVYSIHETRDGELQVGSGNFNISGLRGDEFTMARPRLPDDELVAWQSSMAFLDSRGDWWVNTNKNLHRFTGITRVEDLDGKEPSETYNSRNGLLSGDNLRVYEDSTGNIWISTSHNVKPSGLTRWERSTGKFRHFTKADHLPESAIAIAFAEDRAGNLWFGFVNGEIARYRNGHFTILDEPDAPKVPVMNLYRDRLGRIWIATSRAGLFRMDNPTAEHPTFKRYTIADGLASNNVRCITEDLYGNIYVGTVRGVNRLSPETGKVKYYGTSDGLASDFINTAFRDRSGAIWFGTFNGLSKLVPEPDAESTPPPILISGLKIAGEDYSVSPLGQRAVFAPEQSANRNNLQIDFLSVNTGGDAPMRYQYKLEGADADWSEPKAENSVTFANLSSGAYRFLVRAVNADGAPSEQPAVVSFTVLRPVWQRWWFLLLGAIAASAAIYALYRYRVKQIIYLERVRTRIATDLHDDIGSSLSKIAILSEVVRQKSSANGAEQRNGTNEPLEIIANTSREMVDSMSDIVWAIDPERDHLSDLIQRMRRFTEELLDTQDIGYQFIVPEGLKDIALGADFRREIYLIFKETINNLAKHSGATETEITVRLENEALIIEVKDNGRGFEVVQKSNGKQNGFGGNGLRNMKKRAKKCGGDFRVDSETGGGTRVVLKIPVNKNYFPV